MSIIPITIFGNQLTSTEVTFIQNLSGLTYAQGDILYYNGTTLTNLAPGTSGYYLKTQGAGANPVWATVAGSGTVTSVSVVTANGISGTVATDTTTPAITLTLGVITPTSVNGLTFVAAAIGFTVAGGTTSKTLTVSNTLTLAGTDTSTLNIGTGGTLGTAAFTAATAYAAALSGTINEIAYFNSATTITSLAVATYPSLTELSYIKGLTSAIQTQLNAKGVGDMVLASVQSVTGLKTFDTTKLAVKGSSTGSTAIASANAGASDYTQTLQAKTGTIANSDDTFYIGTTQVALNRASAALTLAGLTLTTPDIGTPSAGVLTNATGLPIAGLVASTSTALGVGSIELGHATDTSISRVSAGVIAVEGVNILTTATGLPLAGGTMSGNVQLGENTSIALDPAGSADGKYSGITISGTAGATLAFGDVIVLDVTASKWLLADANSAAAADGDARGLIGMCVLAANDTQATTILLNGTCRADANFPALTITAPVYLSETAGDIQVAQPTTTDVVIRTLGFALTADEIYFNPSADYITHT